MRKFYKWLSNHKIANIVILIIYYLVVVLPHEQVGLFINGIFKPLGRSNYNLVILVLCAILLIAIFASLWKRIRSSKRKNLLLFGFGFTILLMILVNSFLFVINIESIHYVQYAVFAILFFPLINNYIGTLYLSTLAGAIDEAYQYFYLAPERTDYYDFNDVITNLLGAAMGLLILKSLGIDGDNSKKAIRKKFVTPLLFSWALISAILITPLLSVYDKADPFQLVRKVPEGFWITLPPNETFHVVAPWEGMVYLVFLFACYLFLFGRLEADA